MESDSDDGRGQNAGQSAGSSRPTRHQRPLMACTACRALKTKCLDNEDQVTPCRRCKKMGVPCYYQQLKRGRKPDGMIQSAPVVHAEFNPSHDLFNILPDPSYIDPPATIFNLPNTHFGPVPTLQLPRTSPRVPTSTNIDDHLDPNLRSETADGLSGIHDGVWAAQAAKAANLADDDPIALGLMSLAEAEELLAMFHKHLNDMLAILDPALHTLQYLRNTSNLLLTAIAAAASRFFRRSLRPLLLNHCQLRLSRALVTGECDLGTIQALLISCCWRAPNDKSSWVKLGTAIRLGYQMGLHRPRRDPLPQDEMTARIIADGERTWYALSCVDRMHSDILKLPITIPPHHLMPAVPWAIETKRLRDNDMRVACSMSSSSTYRLLIEYLANEQDMAIGWRRTVLTTVYDQFEQHLASWFLPDPSQVAFRLQEQMILKWFDINHLFKLKYRILEICEDHERLRTTIALLDLARGFTVQTELLAMDGCLAYFHDTSAVTLSTFGLTCEKMLPDLDTSGQRTLLDIIKRVYNCTESAAAGNPESVMTFVSRFLLRLLHSVNTRSRAHSPPRSEPLLGLSNGQVQAQGQETLQMGVDVSADLDEFLRTLAPLDTLHDPNIDTEFWASLIGDA